MLYLFITFVSAFLLFQVQPLIAKLILPLFGGGAAVWTACLLFFQAFLLLGYFYAHLLTQLKTSRQQGLVHAVIVITSLICLPMGQIDGDSVISGSSPLSHILLLLVTSIGLPYFLLSTTGPLVQRWLSYADEGKIPYKLYALSNAGSLLALVSYPFIFEPQLTLNNQTALWSLGYGVFVLTILVLCWLVIKQNKVLIHVAKEEDNTLVKQDAMLWLLLSAFGVVLLVSTTSAMTQNVPPVPFLWILPLCLYLLTFIICFQSPRWYVRWYWFALFVIASFAGILMFFIGSQFDIVTQVSIYSVILFSACMLCHGELARLKPPVSRLTAFYLYMSLGGFLGSAFIAFVAQNIFDQFLEFPLGIIAVYLGFIASVVSDKHRRRHENIKSGRIYFIIAGIGFAVANMGLFGYLNLKFTDNNLASSRNFYGVLTVKDVEFNGELERRLIDGTTSHGTQSREAGKESIAKSYYRKNTGVALALEHLYLQRNIKVGLIGLGAGTLAAYGRRGDEYRFYELNPDVERMAKQHFSYLDKSAADLEVILGDARVALTKELTQVGSQGFQVLVVDAFSGDSIPAHLLTVEAMELYWQHLRADGVLAIHISNSHLELTPLVRGLAKHQGKEALYFVTEPDQQEPNLTQWVIITDNKSFKRNARGRRLQSQWPNTKQDLVWRDDYSNLLSVLK